MHAGIVASVPYAHTGPAGAKQAQRAEQAGEGAADHQLVVSITRISLSRFGEVRPHCTCVGASGLRYWRQPRPVEDAE